MPITLDRRLFLKAAGALAGSMAVRADAVERLRPKLARVIIDNDFAGDPDGLFQLAHHVLCPSVFIPLIIGSHLPARFASTPGFRRATAAADKARALLTVMNKQNLYRPLAGAELPITARDAWKRSPVTDAIVNEAMRSDTNEPLIYAAGAGLTELALAWLAEPRIGRRLRLIWIGGREHTDLAYPPPGQDEAEFNFTIDPLAAQIIFNDSDIEIWQVARDAYRQMLFSIAELNDLARTGPLGRFLKHEVDGVAAMLAKIPGVAPVAETETYVLGDSPLVTLTALLSPFAPDASSSRYKALPTPHLNEDGTYRPDPIGRPMRVYTSIDSSLTFRDMVSKFKALSLARGAK